jgi:RNA polymerase sigma-54 factor
MSHSLSQSFSQQMRMEQRLTPQLIQSMAILQKPVTDLETYLNDALESNAALEIDETTPRDGEGRELPTDSDGHKNQDRALDAPFERLSRYSGDYDLDFNDRAPHIARRIAASGMPDAKMGALANTASREISLNEYLNDQWTMVDADIEVKRAGEALINHLDPDGYLRVRLEQIAENVRPLLAMKDLETALNELHGLEPRGIGARDIVECLLLQLEAMPGDNQVERTLIRDHLADITHNRLPAVAKATGYSLGEINEAIAVIGSTLHLHPGYLVGDRSVPRIRPDVIVEYAGTGGDLTVRLARGNMPQLRLNDTVAALAKSKENGKSTRDFARQQVEAASVIIDAVNFRQSRLLEVAGSIVEKQREFFNVGPEGLKICRMSDLALELECDPSTISRTVAEKYMQTPRGMYPLRYFFTGGTESQDGESMGWDRVKTRVRELVDAEDRIKPLNDEQIVALLDKEGINISRRTVAKYRQQLDIPTARQRKQF